MQARADTRVGGSPAAYRGIAATAALPAAALHRPLSGVCDSGRDVFLERLDQVE